MSKNEKEIEKNKWISCNEKLPNFGVDVEVTTNNGERFIGIMQVVVGTIL